MTIKSGDVLNGRYEVKRMLGQGGMSTVWLGHDPRLNRPVAIKIIHGFLVNHANFLERFQREASAIASLRHQHVIQVFDYNQHENEHYMVLEYVEGNNLKQELTIAAQTKSFWSTETVLDVMIRLTDAVNFAHINGMLHRDLKPDNVLLRTNGEPVLTDFGIIKMLADDSITRTGAVLGTAAYMAPEQIEGDLVNQQTDIYALGVILFELMCGHRPFVADSPIRLMMKQTSEPPPPLADMVDETRKEDAQSLEPIIYKALQKSSENRYDSALGFKHALQQVLNDLKNKKQPSYAPVSIFSEYAIADPDDFTPVEPSPEELTTESPSAKFVEPDAAVASANIEIARISKLLEIDPLREDQVQKQMRLLARSGNFAGSIRAYTQLQRRFGDELGIEPLPETIQLRDRILSARLSSLHNLRPDASQFVGREEELNSIASRLTSGECRLLTLLGPGGMGKTRISRALIRKLASAEWRYFLHGIWFVQLAPINVQEDPYALVYAIARACNIPISGKESPEVQLFNWFADREALLVLDNFEHIINQAEWVGEFLRQASQVRMLITSRQRLNIADEHIYPIYGFSQSKTEPKVSAREMLDDGSRLFLLTSRKMQPNFRPDQNDLQNIRKICTLLNGMPLGIELAASWTRMLSCQEIVQEIEKNIDFLSTNLKQLPERHRSMRAVFGYSWNLLDAEEQAALMNLSLIRGQFTLETAQEIGQTSFEIITSLVDKSLVQAYFNEDHEDTVGGRSYALHEITRHYARELLAQTTNAWQFAQERYNSWFISLLNVRYEAMYGANKFHAVESIYFAFEDVVQAWQSSLQTFGWSKYDLETASQALGEYMSLDGYEQLGADVFKKALQTLPTASPALLQVIIKTNLAVFLFKLAYYQQAETLAQEALEAAEELREPAQARKAMQVLGDIAVKVGRFSEGIEYGRQSLAIATELDDVSGQAYAHRLIGWNSMVSGRYADAYIHLDQSVKSFDRLGDDDMATAIRANMAMPGIMVGQYEQAMTVIKEDLKLARQWRNKKRLATTLLNLAFVRSFIEEYDEADRNVDESLVYHREIGDKEGEATVFIVMGHIDAKQADYVPARSHFIDALRISHQIQAMPKLVESIAGLSMFFYELDNLPELAWKIATYCKDISEIGTMGFSRADDVLQRIGDKIPAGKQAELREEIKPYEVNQVAVALLNNQLNEL
ncbi:MAG: protein kinase [Chloroflexota bacterium]